MACLNLGVARRISPDRVSPCCPSFSGVKPQAEDPRHSFLGLEICIASGRNTGQEQMSVACLDPQRGWDNTKRTCPVQNLGGADRRSLQKEEIHQRLRSGPWANGSLILPRLTHLLEYMKGKFGADF